jgi:short-subunit dehydrogenase
MHIALKRLNEQAMVITGASSGIGLATAELAAQKGARLVLVARSGETLDAIAARLEARGAQVLVVTADVTDEGELERVAAEAIDRFGRIDTWVNDAGVSIYGRLDQVAEADSRRLFDVNFWALVRGSLVALRHMRKEGGAIINVGSELSESVIPLQGMYSASKHAVKGFTDALRVEVQELDKAPVAITLIEPPSVDTPYTEHARNYLDSEPNVPSPVINPEMVASAILDAAVTARRDVKVSAIAKLGATLHKLSPALAQKLEGKLAGQEQSAEAPRDPAGTLFKPGESGRTHGRHAPSARHH